MTDVYGNPVPDAPVMFTSRTGSVTPARAVTDALYAEMSGLMEKYGERGREKCLQDMRYNLEHLAPALALDEPDMFRGYVRWLVELLAAHGVGARDVRRSLELTRTTLAAVFGADEAAAAAGMIDAGMQSIPGAEERA